LLCRGRQKRLASVWRQYDPLHTSNNLNVGRLKVRISQGGHFRWDEELQTTLHRYASPFDQQLPQSALNSVASLQVTKNRPKLKLEMFNKKPHHLAGCVT